jgi:hypothetical protein
MNINNLFFISFSFSNSTFPMPQQALPAAQLKTQLSLIETFPNEEICHTFRLAKKITSGSSFHKEDSYIN